MSSNPKHEPPVSLEKAPFGHPDDAPLAAQLSEEPPVPTVEFSDSAAGGAPEPAAERSQSTDTAIESLSEDPHGEPDAQAPAAPLADRRNSWAEAASAVVRERPFMAVLLAFAFGALIVRVTR